MSTPTLFTQMSHAFHQEIVSVRKDRRICDLVHFQHIPCTYYVQLTFVITVLLTLLVLNSLPCSQSWSVFRSLFVAFFVWDPFHPYVVTLVQACLTSPSIPCWEQWLEKSMRHSLSLACRDPQSFFMSFLSSSTMVSNMTYIYILLLWTIFVTFISATKNTCCLLCIIPIFSWLPFITCHLLCERGTSFSKIPHSFSSYPPTFVFHIIWEFLS